MTQLIHPLVPKRPAIWMTLWIVWFVSLWLLSSAPPKLPEGPEIPHLDKVIHFGYFGLGAIFATSWLKLKRQHLSAITIILITTLIGASVGALDEYHQSFTPERSGNDPLDWTADLLGSLVGAICTLRLFFPREHYQGKAANQPQTEG